MNAGARATRNLIILTGQSLNGEPHGPESFANQMLERFDTESRLVRADWFGIGWVQWKKADWRHRIEVHCTKAERVIVCMCGGQTDYSVVGNRTGAQCYADQVELAAALHAVAPGVRVIGSSTQKSSDITAPNEVNRQDGNALVVADASHGFDAVVDYAGDPRLADPLDTDYYSDGTHETALGAQVMVDLIEPYVRALLLDELAPWAPGDPWPGTVGGASRDGWSPYVRLFLTAAIGAGTPFVVGPGYTADRLDHGNVVSFPGMTETSELDVDITERLTSVHLQSGAPSVAGIFSKPDAAVLEAELWDPDGTFDPLNSDSVYALDHQQRLTPGTPVALWSEVVDPATAATAYMPMFAGTVDRWDTVWAFHPNDRRATLQATDPTKLFSKMRKPAETVSVGAGDLVSERIDRIVARYGWGGTVIPPAAPAVWLGANVSLIATDHNKTGWDELQDLMQLELGFLHFNRTGDLRWLDRSAWTTRTTIIPRITLGNPAERPGAPQLIHDIVTEAVPLSFDRNLHNSIYAARAAGGDPDEGTVFHYQADQSIERWTEQPLTRTDLGVNTDDEVAEWAQTVLMLDAYPQVTLEKVSVRPSLSTDPTAAYIGVLGAGFVTAIIRTWWTPPGQTSQAVLSRIVGATTDISPWTWDMELRLVSSNASLYGPYFVVGPSTRDTLDDGWLVGY